MKLFYDLRLGYLVAAPGQETPLASLQAKAGDGEEALVCIRAQRPDLVIADIKMPRMDGFALADQLRREFPDLPVVALSGYIDANEIEGHNFVGFLEKPMRLDEFRNMIAGALAREI